MIMEMRMGYRLRVLAQKYKSIFENDTIIYTLIKAEKVNAYNNVKRCYVKVDELIHFFTRLVTDTNFGLYHTGSDLLSYYDRIKILCNDLNIETKENLMPIKNEMIKPLEQNLDTNKLKLKFNFHFS